VNSLVCPPLEGETGGGIDLFTQHLIRISYQILLVALIICLFPSIHLAQASKENTPTEKIKGMSFIGPKEKFLSPEMIEPIKSTHAEWIALMPEATLERMTLQFRPDSKNEWWTKTVEGNILAIKVAKQAGFKVLLKPHILLSKIPNAKNRFWASSKVSYPSAPIYERRYDKTKAVKWRGEFEARNEKDWRIFEKNYEAYILELAHQAEALEVDIFCIGTELEKSATKRPQFWRKLIKKVRAIYHGPIIYTANWDEYQKISFWAELDYIGLNSYFPINAMAVPNIKKTIKNWRPILRKIKKISKRANRKILMTEFGYRNIAHAGRKPWTHLGDGKVELNNRAQYNLYQAFFEAFWDKTWMAGGFSWQWFYQPRYEGNTDFSVQEKPALEVLQHWFKKN